MLQRVYDHLDQPPWRRLVLAGVGLWILLLCLVGTGVSVLFTAGYAAAVLVYAAGRRGDPP